MDRRDFIKSMGVAGGVATGLSAVATNLTGGVAGAAEMAAAQGAS
ncbi:MAG: twin-arginine translocation signal domain-containing protein, partial [Deltaproteobacteria bacterium]|nr:twin-arginine translocation signal domain-containing protein [Deltaproteobacteria bacterium]